MFLTSAMLGRIKENKKLISTISRLVVYCEIIALMFAGWFLFSGSSSYFLISCGIIAVCVVFAVCKSARIFSNKIYVLKLAFIQYVILLLVDIVKSTINVVKMIYSDRIVINPGTFVLNADLLNNQERTMLSNLITMTPGTFVIAVNGNNFLVHALNCDKFESNKELVSIFKKVRKRRI